ncbi:MAG: LPS assembly protein LptD [Nitrospirota bacterium]
MKTCGIIFNKAIFYFVLLTFYFLFPIFSVSAQEEADITADHLEYISETNTYIAKGSVKIVLKDTTLLADEIRLNSRTSDVDASGNVIYEDPEVIIKADRIELNIKSKLGTLYNSTILYKENNIHAKTTSLKKTGERTFFLEDATITSCNADPPAWHITGKGITATKHKSIQGKHAVFRVKNIPVLYTPYFWAPLSKERETGFLFPEYGYSSTRGHYFREGFFWAIRDDQDLSIYLDYYGEKGIAEGLDYRYVISPEASGELWMYHVRDNDPSRELFEVKAYHNQEFQNDMSGYLKLHMVNQPDYYETMDSTSAGRFGLSSWKTDPFGFASEERLQKYLESNLHLSKSFAGGRTYLLTQGRQSLEGSSENIPQSLPEIGLIIKTLSVKNLSFNMAFKGTNFWREEGQHGRRYDINPNLYFSYGRLINITQRLGLRETVYILEDPFMYRNRFLYDTNTSLTTKFFKKFDSFIHIVEPSLEYEYTPHVDQSGIPFFDSTDSIPQTRKINYSLTNRVSGLAEKGIEARFRLSQSYSFLKTDEELSPALAEIALSSENVDLNVNASYDVNKDHFADAIASVKFKNDIGYIGTGRNFRRSSSLDQFTFEAGAYRPVNLFKKQLPIDLHGQLWYDLDGKGIQELKLRSTYEHQCWALTIVFVKKPDEYQVLFAIGLAGIGNMELVSLR